MRLAPRRDTSRGRIVTGENVYHLVERQEEDAVAEAGQLTGA
jgi:hypothetical protein